MLVLAVIALTIIFGKIEVGFLLLVAHLLHPLARHQLADFSHLEVRVGRLKLLELHLDVGLVGSGDLLWHDYMRLEFGLAQSKVSALHAVGVREEALLFKLLSFLSEASLILLSKSDEWLLLSIGHALPNLTRLLCHLSDIYRLVNVGVSALVKEDVGSDRLCRLNCFQNAVEIRNFVSIFFLESFSLFLLSLLRQRGLASHGLRL